MDDLDRSIARLTKKHPQLPQLMATERHRLDLISRLVALRKKNKLSQVDVARQMDVTQSYVAEIESGDIDVRHSTLERYAAAVSRGQVTIDIRQSSPQALPVG